ncbi:MAG: hypothetical protein A2Y12_17120 [Planctomycetes bacterium GWF2_42_9]|nr:MAG: hypothetical protein A2Y12_17120 [Planctomycetes bacterium GWF2_42_9]
MAKNQFALMGEILIVFILIAASTVGATPVVKYRWNSVNYLPSTQGWTHAGSGATLMSNTTLGVITESQSGSGGISFCDLVNSDDLTNSSGWTLKGLLKVDYTNTANYAVTLAVDTGTKFWNFTFYFNSSNPTTCGVHTRNTLSTTPMFLKKITDFNTTFHMVEMVDYDGNEVTPPELYVDGERTVRYAQDGGHFLTAGTVYWGNGNSESTSTAQWQFVTFEVGAAYEKPAESVARYEWDSDHYLPSNQGWTQSGSGTTLTNNTVLSCLTIKQTGSGATDFCKTVGTNSLTNSSGWTLKGILRVDNTNTSNFAVTLGVDTGSKFWNFCAHNFAGQSGTFGVYTRGASPPAVFLNLVQNWGAAWHTIEMVDYDGSDFTPPELYVDGIRTARYAQDGGHFLTAGTVFWGNGNSASTSTAQWQSVVLEIGAAYPEPPDTVVKYEWSSTNYLPSNQGWTITGSGATLTNNTTLSTLQEEQTGTGGKDMRDMVSTSDLTNSNGWTLRGILRVEYTSTSNYAVTLAIDTGTKFWNCTFYRETNDMNSLCNSGVYTRPSSPPAVFLKQISDMGTVFHMIEIVDYDGNENTPPELYIDGVRTICYVKDGGHCLPAGTVFWGNGNSESTSIAQWQYVGFEIGAAYPKPLDAAVKYEWNSVNYDPCSQGWTKNISGSGAILSNNSTLGAFKAEQSTSNYTYFTDIADINDFTDPTGWTLSAIVQVENSTAVNYGVAMALDTGKKLWNFTCYRQATNERYDGVHTNNGGSPGDFWPANTHLCLIDKWHKRFCLIEMVDYDGSDLTPPELYVNGVRAGSDGLYAQDGGTYLPAGTVIWGNMNSTSNTTAYWRHVSFSKGAAYPRPKLLPSTESRWSHGHELLLRYGLQIQAWVQANSTTPPSFNLDHWAESGFTTVFLVEEHYDPNIIPLMGAIPGMPWGARIYQNPGETAMRYDENLMSLQYMDDSSLPLNIASNRDLAAKVIPRLCLTHPRSLNYTMQGQFTAAGGTIASNENITLYMDQSHPDMLMQNGYPYNNYVNLSTDYYWGLQRYRLLAAQGIDGDTSRPIPHGMCLQGVAWTAYGTPSESQIRLNQFSAWTFGCKFANCFVWNMNTGNFGPLLFASGGDNSPTASFYHMKETTRQSRNIGNTLVRLQCYDVRMKAISHSLPSNMGPWTAQAHTETYMTNLAVASLGNGTGDVLIGYFSPLHDDLAGGSYGYNDQRYFMVLNGLADKNKTAVQGRQQIDITFNFGTTGITSLQKVSRDTGQVETVPLTSMGGSVYKLTLTTLDGGTAELFKLNTGAPFIIGPPCPSQASSPSPVNSATNISQTPNLSWVWGTETMSHDVYFGANQTNVTNATRTSSEYSGNQIGTAYKAGTLAPNTIYYWRIDEVGKGGTKKGTTWSFTTCD